MVERDYNDYTYLSNFVTVIAIVLSKKSKRWEQKAGTNFGLFPSWRQLRNILAFSTSWVTHLTKVFSTCYSCLYHSFMLQKILEL